MNTEEIYKDIDGYNGLYQISNFGNVISLKSGNPVILKPRRTSKYAYVSLNGKTRYIHHLVASTFLGHVVGREFVIDHIDNNGQNNHIDNLQIITTRENCTKERYGDKGGYKNGKKTSKYVGVYFCKQLKRWRADIKINGKKIYLGYYDTEEEAYNTYLNNLIGSTGDFPSEASQK